MSRFRWGCCPVGAFVGSVYSYIRFSHERQALGASVDRQQDKAEVWAKAHGMTLDRSLSMRDEGLSAFHQKHIQHGALGVFLAAVQAGKIAAGSVLVVEALDRLSRAAPMAAMDQMRKLVDAGIKVVTSNDGTLYSGESIKANPFQLMQSLMGMILAHQESAQKSTRVSQAIHRQCEQWISDKKKDLVRVGKTPGWLQVVNQKWQVMPRRAVAIKRAVELFAAGKGTAAIARELHAAGLMVSNSAPTSTHLVRMFTQPALVGDKVVTIDGETFTLADYYPAVITREEQAALASVTASRLRAPGGQREEVPSVITGLGITRCGYCGTSMKGQTMKNRQRPDGTIPDADRRLQCGRINSGDRCPVPGSCSVAPAERAIVSYCSDIVNLRSLYAEDGGSLQRGELKKAQSKQAETAAKLDRLSKRLEGEDDIPATLIKRMRELEVEAREDAAAVAVAERNAGTIQALDHEGAATRWLKVQRGLLALDHASRLQARQLVSDTFEQIEVWHHGERPDQNDAGEIDLLLRAKGSTVVRKLRIARTGNWLAMENAKG